MNIKSGYSRAIPLGANYCQEFGLSMRVLQRDRMTPSGRLRPFRLLKITPCDRLLCDTKRLLIKHDFQQCQWLHPAMSGH